MLLPLLKIRLLQLKRQFRSLGVLYGLLLLLILPLLIYVLHQKYQDPKQALYISAFLAVAVIGVHFSRKDRPFVLKQLRQPVINMFAEYTAFTLPFAAPALFTAQWYLFTLLLGSFFLIASIRTELKKPAFIPVFSKLIPAANFEWISGLRSAWLLLLLLQTGALATCWLKFVPLLFLWIFTVIVSNFYLECEPLHMLFASGKTARAFLLTKLKSHSRLLLTLLLPALLLNSLFHPDIIWVNLLFLLLQLILLAFAILLKYTTYSPNTMLRGNSILLGLAAFAILIPFMLPVPLLMSIRNYGRAKNNLNYYLHD